MYKPRNQQTFFCSKCDCNLVDSENPDTGTFYLQYGLKWNEETKDYDGSYSAVMFAICSDCAE